MRTLFDNELEDEFDDLEDEFDDLDDDDVEVDDEIILSGEPEHRSAMSRYLMDIGQFPQLTQDEEVELAKLIEKGKQAKEQLNADNEDTLMPIIDAGYAARERFINSNYRLVVSIVKRYAKACNRTLTFFDLIQAGNLGLMLAVDKFDYTKGLKFSTYATWWIRQHIVRDISNVANTVRVPVHMQELIGKIYGIERRYGDITNAEIAEHLDITEAKVAKALQARDSMFTTSLDNIVVDHDSLTPILELIVSDTLSPEEVHNIEAREQEVFMILGDLLTDREFYVISRRFGLLDGNSATLEVIGAEMNVTRERIRQIEAKGLRKLRTPRIKKEMRALLKI